MAFKLNPPFSCDNTPVYQVDTEEGVLGMANKNGTILLNKYLSPAKAKEVMAPPSSAKSTRSSFLMQADLVAVVATRLPN